MNGIVRKMPTIWLFLNHVRLSVMHSYDINRFSKMKLFIFNYGFFIHLELLLKLMWQVSQKIVKNAINRYFIEI